ncbi:uncharacterized protein FSUBG_376 [Fusarium subglutinans]|uniref:Uncharacterized protein n=1 Tax=Gibberella subglutinans TaxID=42677 RepID=A0A8H5QEG4_GIBSU|nr:uncharacterized protein FSUBG_376 [Fusarium subglutinans]KAF5613764.1 hypothetical protein FSUBG_376 [Fusarium subglutinans]
MGSEASSGTLSDPYAGELEYQDLQGQLGNDVTFTDDDVKTALNLSIGDTVISLPLSFPEETFTFPEEPFTFPEEPFTNPATYSYEETISCLQRGIDQFWDDDMASGQINAGTNMYDLPEVQIPPQEQNPPQPENPPQEQNPPQERNPPQAQNPPQPEKHPRVQNPPQEQERNPPQAQNPPQAPSATPDVKPIPQARARGAKRGDPGPSPRAAKRPANRDDQPATKKVKSGESSLPRAAKPTTRRNRQPATKGENSEKPRKLRKLLPKPPPPEPIQPYYISPMAPVPCQQEFQANRGIAYSVDNPALYGANRQPASHCNETVSPGIQGLYNGSSRTRVGMDPGGAAFSDSVSIHRSSYMVPQSQRTMRSTLPTPASSPGMIPNPMSPQQQQLANGMTMRSALPTSTSSPGIIPNPMSPRHQQHQQHQQLANGMTMGSTLLSPVSSPGQIPMTTKNLPHLNRSMQDPQVGWFPATTSEVTTNPLPWSQQHSYNPFFGGPQSMRQPAVPTGMGVQVEWTPPVNLSPPELGHQYTGLHPTTR